MPKATKENILEICEEYAKSLIEFITVLQKINEKICNICPARKGCWVKEKNKKLVEKGMQTKNLLKLTSLVGTLVEHIAKEIALQTLAAIQAEAIALEKGTTKINIE